LPKTTEVSHSECAKCHKGFENAKIKVYGLPFPHQKHIARILNCNVCHAAGEEHGKILKSRMECLSCHHQSKSKCTQCHETQTEFIRGEALGEKDPEPDVMANAVGCTGCHTTISERHSLLEVKKTCVQCHETRYGKMTDEWQKEIAERTKKLTLTLETLRTLKKEAPDSERRRTDAVAQEVEHLLKVIHQDKSKGVHNFSYATKLLSEAEKKVLPVN